jgi:hypothetical protein
MAAISNRFVSRFSQWAEVVGYPDRIRRRLPAALKRLPSWLATRDDHQDMVVRTLDREGFNVNARSDVAWIYTSDNKLVLGTVGPAWTRVRNLSSDEDVDDVIDRFVFFAGQYAVRSRLVSTIASMALSYNVVIDFRAADLKRTTIGPQGLFPSIRVATSYAESELVPKRVHSTRRLRELNAWMKQLNVAEPLVHRAVFQYWRASALANADFGEEAVTALDGLTTVAIEVVRTLGDDSRRITRPEAVERLGLSGEDAERVEHLHQLRCFFGAHPPNSKWWDFSDMYADDIDSFFSTARRLIASIAQFERRHRRVGANPARWSEWFVDNAELLFDAVWFDRVPPARN